VKKKFFMVGKAVLLLILVISMSGCGANPKGLAKQSYDLALGAVGAALNPSKTAELTKKAADIEKKVAKLSASDRAAYEAELARLAGQGLGGLLDAATGLNETSVQDALDTAGKLNDTAKQANDLLNSLGGKK